MSIKASSVASPAVEAWLLPLEQALFAVVAETELFYLIDQPTLHFVPCALDHCCHVIAWESLLLPLADPSLVLQPHTALPPQARLAAVVGYVQADGSTVYAALRLADMPERIQVSDAARCELPNPDWGAVANAAFTHKDQPVAVLALDRLFAAGV